MSAPRFYDGTDITMESGVNDQGKPFCKYRVEAAGGAVIVLSQFSPDELRAHALACLQVAEAAEQDALVMREITETIESPEAAVGLIVALRKRRLDGR